MENYIKHLKDQLKLNYNNKNMYFNLLHKQTVNSAIQYKV